jgi:hypothetical protein
MTYQSSSTGLQGVGFERLCGVRGKQWPQSEDARTLNRVHIDVQRHG